MVLFSKVTNFTAPTGFSEKGIMFEYDTEAEYEHDFRALLAAKIVPQIFDRTKKHLVVDQHEFEAIRLHRGPDTGLSHATYYWSKNTGEKVPEKVVRFLACAEHFFVKEELRPPTKLKLTGVMVEVNDEPDYDNMARDYEDAQAWADQPTPYDS